jgi:hypothetical protein
MSHREVLFTEAICSFQKPASLKSAGSDDLVIARRFLPKRSVSFKEMASLRNARHDGFLL